MKVCKICAEVENCRTMFLCRAIIERSINLKRCTCVIVRMSVQSCAAINIVFETQFKLNLKKKHCYVISKNKSQNSFSRIFICESYGMIWNSRITSDAGKMNFLCNFLLHQKQEKGKRNNKLKLWIFPSFSYCFSVLFATLIHKISSSRRTKKRKKN